MKSDIFKKAFSLNDKSVLIILRFLVILVSLFLVIYSFEAATVTGLKSLIAMFALYALSNVTLFFMEETYFSRRWFRMSIFALDIVLISLIIFFSHGIDTDMYLVYFLIIFMAGGKNSIGHAFMMTVVVVVIYTALLSLRGGDISFANSSLLLRIPFFFILSFIFLYYADSERRTMEKQVAQMERLSALGEMLAAIMHEIRNPLSVLLSYSHALKEAKSDKDRQEMWDEVISASEKTSLIIKNIMSYVRQGEVSDRMRVNINDVVEMALGLSSEQLRFDKISLKTELGADMPEISGNVQSLEQVFVNLINNARNALKAQEQNSGKQITVATSHKKKSVFIMISDNGPGIKKEALERLFEPFFTTHSEGTGLGLSLCYRIIHQHGGAISVQSTYGQGAVFTVELPAL
jgi:signal transduction histidine kinase